MAYISIYSRSVTTHPQRITERLVGEHGAVQYRVVLLGLLQLLRVVLDAPN